jgi:hypothetical protein
MDDPDQLLPLCFVLMPFGKKMDAAGRVTNFDSVYAKIIAPAVERSGLEPIRADEEKIGGTIHKPMFERLMLCHYAVADITGANPNVFYELGIRHAMRPRSTVIVFAELGALPFKRGPDVDASGILLLRRRCDHLATPTGAAPNHHAGGVRRDRPVQGRRPHGVSAESAGQRREESKLS